MNAIQHQVAQTLSHQPKIKPRTERGLPRIMAAGVIIEEMRAAGRGCDEIGEAIGISAGSARTYGAKYRRQIGRQS